MAAETSGRGQVQEFLRVLRRRYWQVLLPALFVLTLGSAFAVIVPKKYVVDTRIEIRESRNERDYLLRNPTEAATAREIYNIEEHIKHFHRVRLIIETSQKLWPEYVKADTATQSLLVKKIIKNISVKVIEKNRREGSTFVDITYKDVDKRRAEDFLTNLTDAWIKDVVERDVNNLVSERDVLQNQVQDYSSDFNDIDHKYMILAQEMGVDPSEPLSEGPRFGGSPGDWWFSELKRRKTEREDTLTLLAISERTLKKLEEDYEREPEETREVQYEKPKSFADKIAELEQQKLELRNAQRRYKAANTNYKKLESRIQELDTAVQEMLVLERTGIFVEEWVPNKRRDDLRKRRDDKEQEVASLRANLTQLDERIEELELDTSRRTENYRLLIQLAEDRKLARGEYEETKEELADKEQALGIMKQAYGRPFDIATPPIGGQKPTEPNPLMIIAFSLFAGLAVGLGVALLLEYGRNSYRTVQELAMYSTAPVLGSIGTIVTRAEARKTYLRRGLVGASSAIILGGVSWMTWVWRAAPDKLPVEVLRVIEDFQRMLM